MLDLKAILSGLVPFVSAAGIACRVYESKLRKKADGKIARLRDLPTSGQGPEFTFYATCLQTGSSFRFSREGLCDWKLGHIPRADITLGTAIAASAAGHAAAIYYSLVESCEANAVNRLTYQTYNLSNARSRAAQLPTPDEFAELSAAPAGGCAL